MVVSSTAQIHVQFLHHFQWWVGWWSNKFWVSSISWGWQNPLIEQPWGTCDSGSNENPFVLWWVTLDCFFVHKSSCEISAKKKIAVLDGRVIHEVTLSSPSLSLGLLSPPVPYFSGICKVRNLWLNLSMKCWNSAVNAQGSRVIIVVDQVGASVKIYVVWQLWRRSGKRREGMKLNLPPKLVAKLVWVSVISFCRIFIPS
jgi:hypothetical protein